MIKWLLVSGFAVNFLAFFWFRGQQEIVTKEKVDEKSWQAGLAGEIILLSELELIPAIRPLPVTEAPRVEQLVTEKLDALALASIEPPLESGNTVLQAVADHESFEPVDSRLLGEGGSQQRAMLDKEVFLESRPLSEAKFEPEPEPEPEPESESEHESEHESVPEVRLELQCVALGRFDKEQDANSLLEKLQQAVGVEAKVNEVAEGVVRYLVYMGPFETQAMAKEQQAVLKEGGVRSSLYYKGDLQNSLSLGYFGSLGNAERRYESLLAAGRGVELKTIETQVIRYWIELQRREDVKLSQNFWRDMAEEFPSMTHREVECSAAKKEGQAE